LRPRSDEIPQVTERLYAVRALEVRELDDRDGRLGATLPVATGIRELAQRPYRKLRVPLVELRIAGLDLVEGANRARRPHRGPRPAGHRDEEADRRDGPCPGAAPPPARTAAGLEPRSERQYREEPRQDHDVGREAEQADVSERRH